MLYKPCEQVRGLFFLAVRARRLSPAVHTRPRRPCFLGPTFARSQVVRKRPVVVLQAPVHSEVDEDISGPCSHKNLEENPCPRVCSVFVLFQSLRTLSAQCARAFSSSGRRISKGRVISHWSQTSHLLPWKNLSLCAISSSSSSPDLKKGIK